MRCKCGAYMIWNCDYKYGIFVSWYTCPSCGYDTRNQQYIWSDRIELTGQKAGISNEIHK